jgi:hypothetical protein
LNQLETNQVLDCCKDHFVANGFVVPARRRVYADVAPGVLGWVGLSVSHSGDELEIFPNVGVHHTALMKIVSGLSRRKYVRGDVATYAMPLVDVMRVDTVFRFSTSKSSDSEVRRLVGSIVNYGLPWMRRICTLDALLPLLRERESMLGGVPERVAVALALLGRNDDLAAYLQDRQSVYDRDSANPNVAAAWRTFADGLSALDIGSYQASA